MAFFKRSSARHRAETSSHFVRNTTAAAAAGAALIGSAAPAQAYAQAPVASGASSSWAPVASSVVNNISPATQPAAAQAQAWSVTPQSTATTAVAPASSGIVGSAMQGVGTGYVWGGTSFGAWDCSGFTQWVYAQNGIDIPRTTYQQIAAATPTANPQPGDLVSQNGGSHIGVYIGNGKMVSALNPTQGTFVHSVNAMPVDGYYTYR